MIEKNNLFFIFVNFIIQSKEFHGIEKVFFENIKVLIYNRLFKKLIIISVIV